jgi:serine/threonine-protein kinase
VDLARDLESNGLVAIKRLRDGFLGRPRPILTLRNEAAALTRTRHPGVPRLVAASFDIPDPYIVMEYVDGEKFSMKNLKCRENVLKAGIDVCSILCSIHVAGIVHKDVKPSNIILKRSGVTLIDFGLARIQGMPDFASGGQGMVGTPIFMAPEQTYARAIVDRTADIYSLGMILYLFLSGHYPYVLGNADDAAMVNAHRFQKAMPINERVPSLPHLVCYAVMRALEKDPTERFQDAGVMKATLIDGLKVGIKPW